MQLNQKLNPETTKILWRLQKESKKHQVRKGSINLRYLDETGFCLTPYVPYGWQEKNETDGVNSKQSKRLNVVGLLNAENKLESYIFETRITSEVIIKFLDIFVKQINKLTVIILDNAPIHKSKAFQKKRTASPGVSPGIETEQEDYGMA